MISKRRRWRPHTMSLGLSMAVAGVAVEVWDIEGLWGLLTRYGWLRCIWPGNLCCVTVTVWSFWSPRCFYGLRCGKGICVLLPKIIVGQVNLRAGNPICDHQRLSCGSLGGSVGGKRGENGRWREENGIGLSFLIWKVVVLLILSKCGWHKVSSISIASW